VALNASSAMTGSWLPWTSKEYSKDKIHLSFLPKKSEIF